jgi:hypothetical protein
VFDVPTLDVTTLLLTIDEGDNVPLPLGAPRLLLPSYRLRFFRTEPERLTLHYGDPSLRAPRYDLALLAPRLIGVSAHEVWPEEENPVAVEPTDPALTQKRVFWAALILAVLVLLGVIGKLTTSASPPAESRE